MTNHIPVYSVPKRLSYNIPAPCLQRKSWRIPPYGYKIIVSDGLLLYSFLFSHPQYEFLLAHSPNISSNYLTLTSVHYCCCLFPKETKLCGCTVYPSICLSDSFPSPPQSKRWFLASRNDIWQQHLKPKINKLHENESQAKETDPNYCHHCGKGGQSSAILPLAAATWSTSQHVLAHPSAQRGPCLTATCTVNCPSWWHKGICRDARLLSQGKGLKDTNLQETQLLELEVSSVLQLMGQFKWQPCLKVLFLYQTPIFSALYKYWLQKQSLPLLTNALVILMAVSVSW